MFYVLEPEVAGGWGEQTVADTSVHPPRVERLHYEFDGWLGDELLETFPCFVVSEGLAAALVRERLVGFSLADCMVSKSRQFEELHPGRELPAFKWLRPTGTPGREDFGLSPDHRLVVSEQARAVLEQFRLENCDVEAWPA